MKTLYIILFLFIAAPAYCGDTLYFCESYTDGEEIGAASEFAPGNVTVMLRTYNPINDRKVFIEIWKDGRKLYEIPFNVNPAWDYMYFSDLRQFKFKKEGYYTLRLYREKDGSYKILAQNTLRIKR